MYRMSRRNDKESRWRRTRSQLNVGVLIDDEVLPRDMDVVICGSLVELLALASTSASTIHTVTLEGGFRTTV